jgi:hypothetical protein
LLPKRKSPASQAHGAKVREDSTDGKIPVRLLCQGCGAGGLPFGVALPFGMAEPGALSPSALLSTRQGVLGRCPALTRAASALEQTGWFVVAPSCAPELGVWARAFTEAKARIPAMAMGIFVIRYSLVMRRSTEP